MTKPAAPLAPLIALGIIVQILFGCGSRVVVDSQTLITRLEPDMRVAVYAAQDENTANIYLTDLSPDEIDGDIPLDDAAGTFIHLHLFLSPRPGRTPIDNTAVSATVRLVVLARGEIGVYGGGGFVLPKGRPGDYTIRAELENASLSLIDSTDQFADLLGPSLMDARFTARRDEPQAARLADMLDRILERAKQR